MTAQMRTTTEIMGHLLRQAPEASLLCLGSPSTGNLPWHEHTGRFAMFGPTRPDGFASRDFTFINATNHRELLDGLKELARRNLRFDMIYFDHNHRLTALFEQIVLTLPLSYRHSFFLFDDAVPPDHRMATPEPTQGWWTGQVCYLRQLLHSTSPDAIVESVKLPPTGLLLARGFTLAPVEEFLRLHRASPTSAEELDAITQPVLWESIAPRVDAALDEIALAGHRVVRLADDSTARRVEVLDEAMTVERVPPRFVTAATRDQTLPQGAENLQRTTRNLHSTRLYTYQDAVTLGIDFIMKDDSVAPRYFNPDIALHRMTTTARAFGSHGNHDTGLQLLRDKFVLNPQRFDLVQRVKGRVMLATPDEPNNYGMWLLLGLISARIFAENRGRFDKLMCYCPRPWQKTMLDAAGITPAEVIEHDLQRNYRCDELSILCHSHRDLWVTDFDRQRLQFVADRVAGPLEPPAAKGRKLFLSRLSMTKAGSYRGLMNEEALIKEMVALGFDIVEPETLPFADQIKLFRDAEVVVGLGGAAMFNTVFCRPGTKVVSIESTMGFVDAHANIFASMGHEYGIIFGEPDETDPRPVQKRWSLNVPVAAAAIEAFTR